jgi:LAS superfamily LD-carboxypeptidase LdcB
MRMKSLLFYIAVLFCFYACSIADSQPNAKIDKTIKTSSDSTDPNLKYNIDPNLSAEDREKVKSIIEKKYLMGKFDPLKDDRFAPIPANISLYPNNVMYMRKEALEKYRQMFDAAAKEGIVLKILSATRPFDAQKAIWERKWTGKQASNGAYLPENLKGKDRALKILEVSSMPSTSRHHWGTDIDINDVEPAYWSTPTGVKTYNWLVKHAHEYGFCQPYSKMGPDRPEGYTEEKWHWSYMPISRELVEKYRKEIQDADIEGFLGSETAKDIQVVKVYVLGINPECK